MQLRSKNLSYLLALALSTSGVVANADSLNGNGTWQTFGGSLVVDDSSPNVGTPYWNNSSGDGPKANVGWCLAGGGACTMATAAPGTLPYYGVGSGSASSMYFTSTGNPVTLSLQTLSTSQTTTAGGFDLFGYYIAGSSGAAGSSILNPIFDSRTSTLGTTVTLSSLTLGQNYGFYIENVQGSGTPFTTNYVYLMDSTANTANGSMPADSLQHFATFNAGSGNYFLGDVDADACGGSFMAGSSPCESSSQFDYNNLIVEVSTNGPATPEPVSLALVGAGLLLVGALVRRKSV